MYSPKFYREERQALIYQLLRDYNFATLLTVNKTYHISHLPMLLEIDENGAPVLLSHFARANPHWKELKDIGNVKFIFNGPHGYISPSWYQPANHNVPTWNYAVVHGTGKFELIEEPEVAFQAMNRLVDNFEENNKTTWILPQNEDAILDLMKEIVVFKVTDIEFEAKFKLAQKQDSIDRNNSITKLEKNTSTSNLASYMKLVITEIA
jgi:transcriptional regulator